MKTKHSIYMERSTGRKAIFIGHGRFSDTYIMEWCDTKLQEEINHIDFIMGFQNITSPILCTDDEVDRSKEKFTNYFDPVEEAAAQWEKLRKDKDKVVAPLGYCKQCGTILIVDFVVPKCPKGCQRC